mgnify:CR=1 FL=1
MTRATPNQRKVPELKDPEGSWAKVVEDMDWILDRFTWETHRSMGRSVAYAGRYGAPGFRWVAEGYFLGRLATDYLEEIWGGILEAAVRAYDTHDPSKTKVHTYVERAIVNQVHDEFEYWQQTSSRQATGASSWEMHLVDDDHTGDAAAYGRRLLQQNALNVNEDERLAVDPFEDDKPVQAGVQVLVQGVEKALTEQEFEAVQRYADGQSQSQIAEDMGLANRREAQTLVDRALRKARKVGR